MEQLKLMPDENIKQICSYCHAIGPPTEKCIYLFCPECGYPDSPDEEPDLLLEGKICPACEEGRLERGEVNNACALCHEGFVERVEFKTCPYCGEGYPKNGWRYGYYYHSCSKKPKREYRSTEWVAGGEGKIAYLRLECLAKYDRSKVSNQFCEGWLKKVESYYAGDKDAFSECIHRCGYYQGNPAKIEVVDIEPYEHQKALIG